MTKYQAIEDNGGGLHLALFDGDHCTHFFSDFERDLGSLRKAIDALKDADDPSEWDGNSDTPQADYDNMTSYEYGWQVVADDDDIYPDRMGKAAKLDFAITE